MATVSEKSQKIQSNSTINILIILLNIYILLQTYYTITIEKQIYRFNKIVTILYIYNFLLSRSYLAKVVQISRKKTGSQNYRFFETSNWTLNKIGRKIIVNKNVTNFLQFLVKSTGRKIIGTRWTKMEIKLIFRNKRILVRVHTCKLRFAINVGNKKPTLRSARTSKKGRVQ